MYSFYKSSLTIHCEVKRHNCNSCREHLRVLKFVLYVDNLETKKID